MAGKSIEMGSLNLVVTMDPNITVTLVVREDNDHIGRLDRHGL
jgi:hypothetical protein